MTASISKSILAWIHILESDILYAEWRTSSEVNIKVKACGEPESVKCSHSHKLVGFCTLVLLIYKKNKNKKEENQEKRSQKCLYLKTAFLKSVLRMLGNVVSEENNGKRQLVVGFVTIKNFSIIFVSLSPLLPCVPLPQFPVFLQSAGFVGILLRLTPTCPTSHMLDCF